MRSLAAPVLTARAALSRLRGAPFAAKQASAAMGQIRKWRGTYRRRIRSAPRPEAYPNHCPKMIVLASVESNRLLRAKVGSLRGGLPVLHEFADSFLGRPTLMASRMKLLYDRLASSL